MVKGPNLLYFHSPFGDKKNHINHNVIVLISTSIFPIFPIKAQPNNIYHFWFSNIIVLTISNYESNFIEKFLRESCFPIFGGKFYVAILKLAFWPPFCNCISDFRFCFTVFLVLLDYFLSGGHFSAKFVRESAFLS